jgi:hypothetical protein
VCPRVLAQPANPTQRDVVYSCAGDLHVDRLTTLEYPWGLAFLTSEISEGGTTIILAALDQ